MYNLTLCDPDGTLIAIIPAAPGLPRFLHITAATVALSDDRDAPTSPDPVTTYARIASFRVDDDRDALFVRVDA